MPRTWPSGIQENCRGSTLGLRPSECVLAFVLLGLHLPYRTHMCSGTGQAGSKSGGATFKLCGLGKVHIVSELLCPHMKKQQKVGFEQYNEITQVKRHAVCFQYLVVEQGRVEGEQ